jgi:hypothetical protein
MYGFDTITDPFFVRSDPLIPPFLVITEPVLKVIVPELVK